MTPNDDNVANSVIILLSILSCPGFGLVYLDQSNWLVGKSYLDERCEYI